MSVITVRHAKGHVVSNAAGLDLVTGTCLVGDELHVSAAWLLGSDGAATRTCAVTDDKGHTYTPHTLRTKSIVGADDERIQSFHTRVVTPGVITIHLALTGGNVTTLIGEYAALVDVSSTAPHMGQEWGQTLSVSSTSLSTGNVVVDAEGAMLVSSILTSNDRTLNLPSGGWGLATATTTEDGFRGAFVSLAPLAVGNYNVAWSWSGGDTNAIALIDAYRAAPAAGPTYTGTYNLVASAGGLDDGL